MRNLRKPQAAAWKSITLITGLAIIGAIILTIIIMACIPVKYAPVYNRNDVMDVTIVSSTSSFSVGDASKQNEILNKLDKSFKTNSLNGLFAGTLGKKATPTYVGSKTLDTLKSEATFVLKINFDDEQTIKNADGSLFKTSGNTVTYKNMYVCLSEGLNSFSSLNVYFSTGETTMSSYVIKAYANTHGTYKIVKDYVNEIVG